MREREIGERDIWTHMYGGGVMKRKRKPGANLLEALLQRNNNLRQWDIIILLGFFILIINIRREIGF